MTQAELEQEMIGYGINRARKMFANNEGKGNAAANPYASALFGRFVLPLAAVVRADLEAPVAGRRKAHLPLLETMDIDAVAFIAVRTLLNAVLDIDKDDEYRGRTYITKVGRAVYNEYCLKHFSEAAPELFFTIANEFERKLSKSERHRVTVFLRKAKDAGVTAEPWSASSIQQVGAYLIECAAMLGMVEITQRKVKHGRGWREVIDVQFTDTVRELLSNIQEHIELTTPEVMPCIEPPKDWTSVSEGGWHTEEMRRAYPFVVRASPRQRQHFKDNDMSVEFTAVNKLQKTAWQVNGRLLEAMLSVARHFDMDEVIGQAEFPAPERPMFLDEIKDKADMTPEQEIIFTQWKRERAEWHVQMKLRGTKWGRFFTATRMARKFKEFNAIYFTYFIDFRGRKYALTTGISPQGSDMQKSLLRFAQGKPLSSPEAEEWFLCAGANRFGVDKVSLADRVRWVKEHHEQIIGFAADPITNNAWREADSPFQFLAWCFEYADYVALGIDRFASYLPIGMDGSCNGLQNFSAMLRDEVGGLATNLVPGHLPQDIYARVAAVTMASLAAGRSKDDPEAADKYKPRWVAHGINRSLVKRSVMTLPYGSTRFSCADFIVGDYMKQGKVPVFAKFEYGPAATFLSHHVWDSIGQVVVKAREAMDWLQKCAGVLIKKGETSISWVSPSGFPAIQSYYKTEVHRINTMLCGGTKLRLPSETDEPDLHRHKNGIAPNFIHSMDAAHLTLTVAACASPSSRIDALAMIHDDYGTHAADCPELARILREVFIKMYTDHDPLQELVDRYPCLPPPPKRGTLVLEDVMNSVYFFR